MSYIGPSHHHPEIARFLGSIPTDAALETLTATVTAAWDRLSDLSRRRDAHAEELQALDSRPIFDASAKEQEATINRRMVLDGLLRAFPAQFARDQRAFARATLAWLARVRQLALDEAQRAQEALDPIEADARAGQTALSMAERAKEARQLTEDEYREHVAAFEAQRIPLHAQAQPLIDQRNLAAMAAQVCEILAQQYGARLRLDEPTTWQDAVEQALQGRQTRALVPA
jgi:hypothetical protein